MPPSPTVQVQRALPNHVLFVPPHASTAATASEAEILKRATAFLLRRPTHRGTGRRSAPTPAGPPTRPWPRRRTCGPPRPDGYLRPKTSVLGRKSVFENGVVC